MAEIGFDQVFQEMRAQLPHIAAGESWGDYCRGLGIDPDGLRRASGEAAEEEFMHIPGMPREMDGRLRRAGLSARQRALVKEALESTFEVAFVVGARCRDWQRAQGAGDG